MTVTTNEFGQQNLFAKEPQMYVSKTDAERYGYETYAERAEKLNGRTAMLGFIAAIVKLYYYWQCIFLWCFRILMSEIIFTTTSIAFFVLLAYSVEQLSETY